MQVGQVLRVRIGRMLSTFELIYMCNVNNNLKVFVRSLILIQHTRSVCQTPGSIEQRINRFGKEGSIFAKRHGIMVVGGGVHFILLDRIKPQKHWLFTRSLNGIFADDV